MSTDTYELSSSDDDNANEEQTMIGHLDTCMQPADMASEVLAQHDDKIYSVAPAEGNKPVSVFEEENLEALAFPVQFPDGKNTLDGKRPAKLSRSKYFNARLLSADGRFAKDAQYIFFAQYTTELEQMTSSMAITMRQGSAKTQDGRKITASMLNDASQLRKLMRNDQGFRFLAPIRGSLSTVIGP